jgi:TonB family protein
MSMRALLSVVMASAFLCGCGLFVLAQSGAPQNSNQSKNDNQNSSPVEEKIHLVKEVDFKARITKRPAPKYTKEAKKQAIEGTVILRAVLSLNGKVINIHTVVGMPFGLTEKAIEAARKIKFVPAMKDGRPVSQYIQIEYNFHLY